jgi:hypothetical protein
MFPLTAPGDYTGTTNRAITFSAGDTVATIMVPTTQDTESELTEQFTATLSNPGTAGLTVGDDDTATVTINDDDGEPRELDTPIKVKEL